MDVKGYDEAMLRLRLEEAGQQSLAEVPDWQWAARLEYEGPNDAVMMLYSDDPDLLKGIAPERIDTWRMARLIKLKPATDITRKNGVSWCIASGASPAWARKVFPTLSEEEFVAAGGHYSAIHEDFMVGSSRMGIDGIRADGIAEPIMREGEWAFRV